MEEAPFKETPEPEGVEQAPAQEELKPSTMEETLPGSKEDGDKDPKTNTGEEPTPEVKAEEAEVDASLVKQEQFDKEVQALKAQFEMSAKQNRVAVNAWEDEK